MSDAWLQRTNGTPPAARYLQTAVWTGSEMIVWGGDNAAVIFCNDGGRYNPASDSWTAVPPTARPPRAYCTRRSGRAPR